MSFEYSGRHIPDDDASLAALVRKEAARPVSEDRRDGRPESQLDWLSGMLTVHGEMLRRIEAAYRQLFAEADPVVVRAILEQADEHPSRSGYLGILVDAIGSSAAGLKRGRDPTRADETTLFGAVVRTLDRVANHRAPLTGAAADQLEGVTRVEDGWPQSELLLLTHDFDRYSQRLIPTLTRLSADDEQLGLFGAAMANAGEPLTTGGFDLIGRAGGALRDRFAERLRAFLEQAEQGRKALLGSEYFKSYPPDVQQRLSAERADPWPEYAARLRLTHY